MESPIEDEGVVNGVIRGVVDRGAVVPFCVFMDFRITACTFLIRVSSF